MRQMKPATRVPAGRTRSTLPPLSVGLARALIVIAAAVGSVVTADVAVADCGGPQVDETPGEVTRGGTITVSGTGFGASCYDTGPPPPGQGALGIPLDINITFEQGSSEILAARGAADATYEFEVDVVVPSGLQPGPATLRVRSSATLSPRDFARLITITDAPAPSPEPVQEVESFGPAQTAAATTTVPPPPAPSAPPAGQPAPPVDGLRPADDSAPVLLLGAAAAAIVGAGAWFGIRRRS